MLALLWLKSLTSPLAIIGKYWIFAIFHGSGGRYRYSKAASVGYRKCVPLAQAISDLVTTLLVGLMSMGKPFDAVRL